MVSVIPTHMAAFIRSTDCGIWRTYKDDGAPDTAWIPGWARELTNGIWMRDFVTIKRIDGEVDVFAVDGNHSLNQSNFNFLIGHGIGPWKNLGGKLVTIPAVANSKGTIHIFHIGTDHALYHNSWDGTNHTPFEKLGGVFAHTPAAVSAGEKEVSVFAVGLTDGLLHHYHWSLRSGWAPVEKLPGIWAGTPCAISDSDGSWDVFGVDPNGKINHVSDHDGSRSSLETFDGLFQTIDAVSWGPTRIDLIALGLDRAVYHKAWDSNAWGPWENLGGILTQRPTPVTNNRGALCVLGVGMVSNMFTTIRDPINGVWSPWLDLKQYNAMILGRVA